MAVPLALPDGPFRRFVQVWNHLGNHTTPELHMRLANWLENAWSAHESRLQLMVFRDAGKSTLVGLFCAWLLASRPDLRVLVLSAEANLASKMTRSVRRIIERHPATQHLQPAHKEEWASDQITVARQSGHRDPSLLARGLAGNITGCRADVVICDDVEVPNTANTAAKREELRERLKEVGFVLVPQGLQLFIGTPQTYFSIYAEERNEELGEAAPFLDGYKRLTVPIYDRLGNSVWPERFTIPAIQKLQAEGGPARFRSQMLLTPSAPEDLRLDPDRLVRYEAPLLMQSTGGRPMLTIDGRRMVGAACWWDPALARPDRGDASVVAAVFTDDSGGYWLHGITYLEGTDDEHLAHHLCRQVIEFAQRLEQPAITVEANGLGRFLPTLLRQELARSQVAITVREQTSTMRKDQRILDAFDPLLAAGALHVHASVWQTPFIAEMRAWLPGGGSHDDGLDAVSGCILSQPVRLSAAQAGAAKRWDWRGSNAALVAAEAEFPL